MKIFILKGYCGYKSLSGDTWSSWIVGYFKEKIEVEAYKTKLETEMIKAEENPEFFPKGEYPLLRMNEKAKQFGIE